MSAPRVYFMDRSSRIAGAVFAALIVALVLAPYWAERQDLRLLAEIYAYVALASAWNLLAGYAGLVSIGQQAYVGLGGYLLFALTMLAGLSPVWSIPLAGLIGAVVSIPVAALVFRLRGHYFAIGTWVVAEVFRLVAAQVTVLGGGSGTSLPAGIVISIAATREWREFLVYWTALALAVLVLALIVALLRSRYGLALTAIRDNEIAALERRRRAAGQARRLRDHGLLHRHGGRGDLPAEAAHLARRRLQRQRLDRLRDLHHGDRRGRPH